jgi:hypothetical protein
MQNLENSFERKELMNTSRRGFLAGLAGAGCWARSVLAQGRSKAIWSATANEPPEVIFDPRAEEPVRFAAAELQRYLTRILGVPTTNGQKPHPQIVLREIEDKEIGDEGFEISSDSQTLTISGSPSGIIFGAFEFLRRFAGCQFSGLGPDCEFVPRRERIIFDVGQLRMKPKLWYRGYQFFYSEPLELIIQRLDWMVRNGLNYVMFTPQRDDLLGADAPIDAATGRPVGSGLRFEHAGASQFVFTEGWWKRKVEPEVFKRGLKLDFNHHNLFYWLPPHQYFKEHPEWYPLVDGQRTTKPRQLAICSSNEGAVRTVVENVKQYLRANPRIKVVGMIVEDGEGMCQCPDCSRDDVDPKDATRSTMEWKTAEGENRSKSLRYARLVNRVAREIRGEFPGVLVGHAAYVDIQWPPRGVKLEPNVVSWVAIYWRDAAHPLGANSPSPVNRFFFDILKQWKATQSARLIAYEYYMGMEAQKSLPYPMSEVICRDWPNLKALGIEGATIQSWSTNHNAYGLNNLAFARNGWEDRVDHQALLDGYLSGMFGSAATEIKPIFERMIGALKRVEKEGPAVSPWLSRYDGSKTSGGSFLPDGYTVVYLMESLGSEFLDGALRRAREKASDARERRQVEQLTAASSYWRQAASALSLDLKAKDAERQGNRTAAASLLSEAATQCERVSAYLKTLPARGWISLATPPQWPRLAADFRKRAKELGQA